MNTFSSSLGKSLKVFAPAKINLHLEVLGFRCDGYHELAMVMQSISLGDQIEMRKTIDGEITLTSNNESLDLGEDNLIIKAARLIRNHAALNDLGASIELKKNIPIGAGLAGGSADAAATLVGLNKLWELDLSEHQLEMIAAELGSDVPFCVGGGTQLCFGRGESLEKLNESETSLAIVLVKDPLVEVATPWAYSKYKETHQNEYLSEEVDFQQRREKIRSASWLHDLNAFNPPPLRNDLQSVVVPAIPAVQRSLKFLSSMKGSLSVAMSGSGPSCFALFSDLDSARLSLEANRKKLETLKLDGWCCNLVAAGVKIS